MEEAKIEELKTIVINEQHNKPSLTSKAMKWIGRLVTTVASKELVQNMPAIVDFVEKIIH